ncbi:hypothetical protein [Sporolituus thermophilus]|uniref:hypothetical protein n=1 Tax=Sporolituus thermophilus TaxID=608505 RepID=UPI000B8908D7|nr:hypothetical protein [Sporolituus thermophilus]
MKQQFWCEHLDKASKYTLQKYNFDGREVLLRVQTWVCPECGVHGADTEIVKEEYCEQTAG